MLIANSRGRVRLRCLFSLFALVCAACGDDSPTSPSPPASGSAPRITAVAPARGSTTSDTIITITGSNFASDATVNVGGVAARTVTFAGPTTLNAVVPGRASAGAADVIVATAGRSVSLASGFTFVAPAGTNQPPVVTSVRSTGTRPNQPASFGDVGENITLTATVTDAETAGSSLTYDWSGPGTFSAAAATTTWQVPASSTPTPSAVTVTLKVSETFTEAGITHKNVSAAYNFVFQLHNSTKEIQDLGEEFLTLFSQSNVPTDTVLKGFSTTCDDGAGRFLEKEDVDRSRRDYTQDFSKFRITRQPVTFQFGDGSCSIPGRASQRHVNACTAYTVHWEITYIRDVDAVRKKGTREVTDGTDYISAVLENNQWRLCHSDFTGTSVIPTLNLRRSVAW